MALPGEALATESRPAPAESATFWYDSEDLASAAGNVRSDSQGAIPTDHTYCFAYGMGAKQMSSQIPWRVADFTGLAVPEPAGTYQLGIDPNWYGSNACQVTGRSMGFQLHKESIVASNPTPAVGNIYGMQLLRNWGSDLSRRPWSVGGAPRLRLQASYSVSRHDAPSGVIQYGQIVASFVDTTYDGANPSFFYAISLWDSRGPQPESVQADTAGTPNYIVNTHAGASRYSQLHPNSQNASGTSGCGCLWYGVYITETNLINAATQINQQFGEHYSTNPVDYAINLVAVGTEMYSPPGANGWIGSRAWDLKALTE